MRVIVINQYASSPKYSTGAGERHFYIAKELRKTGVNTTIISSSYNHLFHSCPIIPQRKTLSTESYENVDFIWLKGKKYNASSGFGRLYSWIEFLFRLFFLKKLEKPDVLVVSSMSIFPAIYASYLKWRYKCKFILEIRDIWPLTLIELGKFTRWNPIIILLKFLEKFAYKKADVIISVLPGFKDYFVENFNFNKEILWIPNGIDLSLNQISLENTIKKREAFSVVYAGAIGTANQMIFLLKAAQHLSDYEHLKFIIIGEGPNKKELVEYARDYNLNSVTFHSKVSKSEVAHFLNDADLCFHACRKSDLYKYGISPNKLNDYMLAKKPILSASGLVHDPVKIANCGLVVEADDFIAIAEGILKLSKLPREELNALGNNGYEYILKNQSYEVIAGRFREIYESRS